MLFDVVKHESVRRHGLDPERFQEPSREVAEVLGDKRLRADLNGERDDVTILVVHWHLSDLLVGDLFPGGWQSAVHQRDPALDRSDVEVRTVHQVPCHLGEDLW